MKNEATNIEIKNPGILEVPDGKNVEDLPLSYFEKLVEKKGYAEISRALTNLEVWNKNKNKSLSKWASDMHDKLKAKFKKESRLRTLIESAKGINENMQYRVYVYDDENNLVDSSKVFDCICAAQEFKKEYGKKHPTYTIEISSLLDQPESAQKNEGPVNYIEVHVTWTTEESEYFHIEERNNKYYIVDHPSISSKNAFSSIDAAKKQLKEHYSRQFGNKNIKVESAQKNEGIEEKQDAIAKKIADALSAKFGWVLSKEGPYEEYYIGKGSNPINVKIKNDKDLQVQLRANEQPKTFKSTKDAIDFIKNNMNAYGFPGGSAFYGKLQSKANKNIERQKARDTYLHDISDSCQKNEAKTIDDFSTKELADFIKTLKINFNDPKRQLNLQWLASQIQKHFNLTYKPLTNEIKDLLDNMPKEYLESSQINETRSYKVTVKLEVPDKMNNRDIEDYIEYKVDDSNFGVYVLDVTAERK